jgi:hypothetical protein
MSKKILLVFFLLPFFLLPSCSSADKRADEPQELLWYVCLRNERSGVERILQVRALSSTQAVDFAVLHARNDNWGIAPIGLVWVRNTPDN